jgi:hypothetical protein
MEVTSDELIKGLHQAFDYTGDNNRDLLSDVSFPMEDTWEELQVEFAYQFLVAYISRNQEMIDLNLKD